MVAHAAQAAKGLLPRAPVGQQKHPSSPKTSSSVSGVVSLKPPSSFPQTDGLSSHLHCAGFMKRPLGHTQHRGSNQWVCPFCWASSPFHIAGLPVGAL